MQCCSVGQISLAAWLVLPVVLLGTITDRLRDSEHCEHWVPGIRPSIHGVNSSTHWKPGSSPALITNKDTLYRNRWIFSLFMYFTHCASTTPSFRIFRLWEGKYFWPPIWLYLITPWYHDLTTRSPVSTGWRPTKSFWLTEFLSTKLRQFWKLKSRWRTLPIREGITKEVFLNTYDIKIWENFLFKHFLEKFKITFNHYTR